jgi:hypothetical protein
MRRAHARIHTHVDGNASLCRWNSEKYLGPAVLMQVLFLLCPVCAVSCVCRAGHDNECVRVCMRAYACVCVRAQHCEGVENERSWRDGV